MRWFKTAGGLLVVMLLMSSCLRVDGTIIVEDDGSGSVDFLTAVDTELLTSVLGDFDTGGADLLDPAEICEDFEADFGQGQDLPPGAVVTPYDEDGFCGSRVEYAFGPTLDQSANVAGILDPSTRLYKEGDNWFFESDFDSDSITSGADGAPDAMFEALFGEASFRLVVDLPGRAIDGANNATEVGSDGRFVWEVDILNPPDRLFAQTEPGSGGGSGGGGLNPIIIGVVVAFLAAGLALFLVNKRKTDEASGAPESGAPIDGPQPGIPGASPPTAVGGPMVPASDAVKETIVMNAADIQQSIQDTAQNPAAAAEPVFDHTLNAWVLDDPTRGRLVHDSATDTWNPA